MVVPASRFRTHPAVRLAVVLSILAVAVAAVAACAGEDATKPASKYEGSWSNSAGPGESYHDMRIERAGSGYRVVIMATGVDDGKEYELAFDAFESGDALTFTAATDPDTETATITVAGDTLTLEWYESQLTFARD
jgi:hypothetical protein